jgi:hypothetical protein
MIRKLIPSLIISFAKGAFPVVSLPLQTSERCKNTINK